MRGLFGVSEGAVANPIHKLENHWLLPNERGWAYGMGMGFGYLGLILGTPLVAWLIESWGWRVMFYSTGALTLLGVIYFWLLVYDHPQDHPWISEAEKTLIADALAKDRVTFDPQQGPARTLSFGEGIGILAKNPAFWTLCFAGFCALGVFFTNLSWLPGYLVKERGYAVVNSGFYLILPYAAAFAGALSAGYLGDRWGNRSAVALCTGLLTGPAILGLLWAQEVSTVIVFMSLVLFLNAAATNSLIVVLFDLFPAEVLGITIALFAGVCGGAGGIVGPIVLGHFYDQTGSFFWGFCSLAGGAALGALVLIPIVAYERRVKRQKAENAALAQGLRATESLIRITVNNARLKFKTSVADTASISHRTLLYWRIEHEQSASPSLSHHQCSIHAKLLLLGERPCRNVLRRPDGERYQSRYRCCPLVDDSACRKHSQSGRYCYRPARSL